MIYSNVYGRCGNQFFQYAFCKKLAMLNDEMPVSMNFDNVKKWRNRTGDDSFSNMLQYFQTDSFFIHSGDQALNIFGTNKQKKLKKISRYINGLDRRIGSSILGNICRKKMVKNGIYYEELYDLMPQTNSVENIFVNGYFENPAYFQDIKSILVKQYTPIYMRKEKNKKLYEIIENTESVCVSFRTWKETDQNEKMNRHVCGQQYYTEAIRIIKEKIPNAFFVVFSDDVQWVQSNFQFNSPVIFEDGNDEVWEKIRLMYLCKHFIITNSTFAWWAQYLSRNKKKIVISPDRWYRDSSTKSKLILDDWIKIKV